MKQTSLEQWLLHAKAKSYFGRGFPVKLAVLACLIEGGNLSELARTYGITRQVTSKLARLARKAYGIG